MTTVIYGVYARSDGRKIFLGQGIIYHRDRTAARAIGSRTRVSAINSLAFAVLSNNIKLLTVFDVLHKLLTHATVVDGQVYQHPGFLAFSHKCQAARLVDFTPSTSLKLAIEVL